MGATLGDVEAIASGIATGDEVRPHFLGAVVLAQHDVHGNEIPKRAIIDGQQRLTTLQILLAALRDEVSAAVKAAQGSEAEGALQDLLDSVSPLTRNTGLMKEPKVERHKVWPTNADREVYTRVLTAGSYAALDAAYPIVRQKYQRHPDPGPRMVEAYRFFSSSIRDFLARASANATRHPLEALFYAFQRFLHLVVIELEREDDPQAIFESLNAHGVPLRASDLIRNHLFGKARAQGEDPDALYASSWRHFDDANANGGDGFWRREVKQGRLRHPRFDLFLQHFLMARTGADVSPIHVYKAWVSYWQKTATEPRVQDELARIAQYSEVFRSFHEPSREAATRPYLARFLRRVSAMDTSTFYPVLLYLLTEPPERVPPTELEGMLAALESYLVRAWVCESPAKAFNRIFLSLLKQLREATTLDAATLRGFLLGIKGDNAWATDAAFEKAWMNNRVYETLRSGGVQMVLGAIHEQMLTSKQEQVTIASALTVEHIMPQSWQANWPLPSPLPPETPDVESATERRNQLVQTFGNLTLLTQALNSAVSNGAYPNKRAEFIAQTLLRLNTYFLDVPAWDEQAIVARGKTLFGHAKAIWKYGP